MKRNQSKSKKGDEKMSQYFKCSNCGHTIALLIHPSTNRVVRTCEECGKSCNFFRV